VDRRNHSRSRAVLGSLALVAGGTTPATADGDAAPPALDPALWAVLSDDELIALAARSGEMIVVWDERPDKPFDRDTELRLTDRDLAERGVADLASALADEADVVVRAMGRGGQQIDIRGARKAGVKLLLDGAAVDDPYYGTFDLSSVAITDVVQIRIATSPASPLDGPGGPGGVVEVHTRDAVGDRAVIARLAGDTLPTAAASVTGRAPVAAAWAARLSATGTLGSQELAAPGGAIDEARHLAGGAARVEWRPARRGRRAVVDLAAQERAFLVPPTADEMGSILSIRGEDSARAGARFEDRVGATIVDARLSAQLQRRDAAYFADRDLDVMTASEDLTARRAGAAVVLRRPLGARWQAIGAAHLVGEDARVVDGRGAVTSGASTIGELAAGARWRRAGVRVDGAGGVAIPVGVGEAPWPEAKLTAAASPVRAVTVTATVARKGRLPTLRERYRLDVGNARLGPELASFGEVEVELRPADRLAVTCASWVRRQTAMIVLDRQTLVLTNVGRVDLRGTDASARVRPRDDVEVRASYSFIDAADATADEPLDFLPRHRATAQLRVTPAWWVTGGARLAWIAAQRDRAARIPAHSEWDLDLVVRPDDSWLVAAGIDDVLDARWPIRGGVPSPGRTFRISVQATF
jgi:outer membrane receptor protein involved in Fe transport